MTNIHVLLGDGTGGFTQSLNLPNNANDVALGDLLSSGHVDIGIVVSQFLIDVADTTVAIFPGNGTGGFGHDGGSSGQFSVPETNASIYMYTQAARLHKTGAMDLIAEDAGNHQILTFHAEGQQIFNSTDFTYSTSTPLMDGAGPMTVMDLNGDGYPDLVVNGQTGYSASVYLGNGDGTFQAPAIYRFDHNVHSLLLADMDGDGHVDMLVEGDSGAIEIFHGNADGTFAKTSEGGTGVLDASTGNGGHLVGVGDLNHDGVLDLITATPRGLSVLLGQGGLAYKLDRIYDDAPGPHASYVVADFDQDGALDVAEDTAGGVAILYGAKDALTTPGVVSATPSPAAFEGAYSLVAKLNGAQTSGTVDFTVDGNAAGTAPVVNGAATLAVAADPASANGKPLLPGMHALGGTYFASASALAAELTGGTLVVSLAPSTVTLTPAPPTVTLGPTYFYGQGVNGYVHFNVIDPSNYPATGTWTQLSNGVAVPGCVDLSAAT